MSERKVLFIVEGRRGEPRLLKRMHNILFDTTPENIYWHGAVIYDLLLRMFADEGEDDSLDVVSVLRESVTGFTDREMLEQEFSDVYLVFDMDPHDHRYDEKLLSRAMEFFSESTENGKLYLNYPMLESYRHLKEHDDPEYLERVVSVGSLSGYKSLVDAEGHNDFKQLDKYDEDTFREIIHMNVKKVNWILEHEKSLPDADTFLSWRGSDILDVQNGMCSLIILSMCSTHRSSTQWSSTHLSFSDDASGFRSKHQLGEWVAPPEDDWGSDLSVVHFQRQVASANPILY